MRMIQEIQIAEKTVRVKELTVAEARQLLVEIEKGEDIDILGSMIFEDCSLRQLAHMSGLTAIQLDEFTPSELRQLADAAKKANPHFFGMMERASRIASQLAPQILSAPAASS